MPALGTLAHCPSYLAPMASFAHGRLTMAVHRYGQGPLHVLAFHGFDRSGADFAVLAPPLATLCTLHAFDLPFHGESLGFDPVDPVRPSELAAFFNAYAAHIGTARVGLLGYSLGGRIALCLLEQQPALVDRAFLLAPDGLVARPWYRALAHYRAGRWMYRAFIRHPRAFHGLIGLLHRLHLLDARMYRFLMDRTATERARALLHQVWCGFRLIEPALPTVAENLRRQAIPLDLMLGRHDRVIRPAMARRLHDLAPGQVHVHFLPTGHRMLNEAVGALIAAGLAHGPDDAS